MLIRNKTALAKGLLLMGTFVVIFLLILSPLFGKGMTGLEYADDFFNKLSKNSSDFFDQVGKTVDKFKGKNVTYSVTFNQPGHDVEPDPAKAKEIALKNAASAAKALTTAGAKVDTKDNTITVQGDLGAILGYATQTSKRIFHLSEEDCKKPENIELRKSLSPLWKALSASVLPLQKINLNEEASAVSLVIRKALEPAYNFYEIEGTPVSQNIVLLLVLLIFYVVYTMWYGYAIYHIFTGIGLSTTKAKFKKET